MHPGSSADNFKFRRLLYGEGGSGVRGHGDWGSVFFIGVYGSPGRHVAMDRGRREYVHRVALIVCSNLKSHQLQVNRVRACRTYMYEI